LNRAINDRWPAVRGAATLARDLSMSYDVIVSITLDESVAHDPPTFASAKSHY
jgi:hypothetical protein